MERLKETRLVSRRRDSSRCGRSISPNRLVVGSVLLSAKEGGGGIGDEKKVGKRRKSDVQGGFSSGTLAWWGHGDVPEWSRDYWPKDVAGPRFYSCAFLSLSLSIYLSLSLTSFFIVSHSPCSRTTLSAFLSPRILVSLKVHPDRIGTSLWSLTI